MPEYFAEPDPTTQEMTAAHARSYALAAPHPTGAAAAERPPQIPLAPVKRVQAQFNPLADGMVYLVVFLGGMVGTAMRYGLSLAMPAPAAETGFFSAFHPATFIANMAACFVFAALTAYMSQASWIRKRVRQLTSRGVGMGMCGGFSTLSAMVIEELTSIHGSQIGGFLFYMLVSFAVGMLVAAAGSWLATSLASRRAASIASRAADAGAFDDVSPSSPPSGDYGQPVAPGSSAGSGVGSGAGVSGVVATGVTGGRAAVTVASAGSVSAVSGLSDPSDPMIAPSFEPAPITDEIPMVGDPSTGDAHEPSPREAHGAHAEERRRR